MAAYNGVNGHSMTESPLLREVLQERVGLRRRRHVGLVRHAAPTEAAAQRGARPRDAGPARPVGRRARRRGARRARRRGDDRRQGAADPAARRARRRARGHRAGAPRRPTTTPRSPPSCAASPRPASCSPATRARCCRSTPSDAAPRGRASARTRRSRGRSAAAARPSTRRTPCRRSTACAPRSATACEVDHWRRRARRRAHARWPARRGSGSPTARRRRRGALPRARTATVLGTERARAAAFNWMGAFGAGRRRRRRSRASRSTRCCAPPSRGRTRSAPPASAATGSSVDGEEVFDGRLELPPGADIVEALMIPPQRVARASSSRRGGRRSRSCSRTRSAAWPASIPDFGGAVFQLNLRRRTAPTTRRSSARSRSRARPTSRWSWSARPRRSRARGSTARRSRCRAARTSWSAASPRPTRRPSWSSTPARRCCCRGPTRSPPCCSRGSPARSSATRSPTCCSAAPSRAAGCPPRGRRPRSGLPSTQPVDGVLAYDEGLFIGYRGTTARRGRALPVRPRPRLHDLGVRRRSRRGEAARRGSGARAQHRRRAAAARSCRSTRAATAAPSSGRSRWLAGFAVVDAEPGEEVAVTVRLRRARLRALGPRRAGRASPERSRSPPGRRRP